MAQPLRKVRQRNAAPATGDGFSFRLPPLAVAAICVVMLACTGWAFFMGYMVGHGQNPGEEMRELTGIGRPDRETLAEMDKALADSEKAGLRETLADMAGKAVADSGAAPADGKAGGKDKDAAAAAPAAPAKGAYPFNKPSADGLAAWGDAPARGAAQPAASPNPVTTAARQQAAANSIPLYDFIFQVAAFRNVDDADRLRQRLEGRGLRTRGQKSGRLTLVMVHMRGTDLDAANLREELQRMRLGSPLQKSKKQVGGKPRPR